MKAVTIDQLHLRDHVRFAEDQKNLDPTFVSESHVVALHPEVGGMSAIYPSKFDSLFELQKRNLPWAAFETPKNFHLFGKRFFSHRLFSHFEWEGGSREKEEHASDQEKEQQEGLKKLMEAIGNLKKLQHQTPSLFEKDKTTLMTLLESIDWINSLLIQINGRKLQYQKG